ncbi:MAG: endonuclease [Bacteroidetes bacterium]|nr:endonuclease [Bacteroidota bacterium]MCL1969516.1 endonuclease [Bacteroidota bacterium]MCL1969678.1 endonuclease [Bacteroidota bacterium]
MKTLNKTQKTVPVFILYLFTLLPFYPSSLYPQTDTSRYCIAFYNVENLFDPDDDPEKNDDAFTPSGFYHWTNKRFYKKIDDIAKVFLAINGWAPPDIIGLAEIENANVLNKLCYTTGLKTYHYRYVHYDSPDARGVDVAMLYRSDRVKIVESRPVSVVFPFEPNTKNRDILYVKALMAEDTLHLFVNHWTSRFGGYGATIPKRNYYAQVLRNNVDSLLSMNENANIVIMGDFNDYPTDESMSAYLQTKNYKREAAEGTLFNLMFPIMEEGQNRGTHKSQEFWGCLDQFIVSKSLLNAKNKWQVENGTAVIFDAPFLLIADEKFGGVKAFRTYLGPKYLGGFADHLPIKIVLKQ